MTSIRHPFNTPRRRTQLKFVDADGNQAIGRTEQHHKDACDINNVLRRYDKTGLITHINNAVGRYGDFTEVNEYQESLNLVREAQSGFMELPSAIRARFNNDPGAFLEFASNPDNVDEMRAMGLAKALPAPLPTPPGAPSTAE